MRIRRRQPRKKTLCDIIKEKIKNIFKKEKKEKIYWTDRTIIIKYH